MEDLKHLVELSKKGDQQAIAQLYEQTSRRAYYLAKQLVKDEDQAQDIVQDAYVKVFTNLPLLEQVENFQGWLNTIVVNRSKDYLKKKKPMLFSQMVSEEDEGSELDFEDEGGYFSPDQKVDYAETKRLIQGMIDRLPQEQRMAIVLFYLEEMPVKQIARVMECSEGTVKSRLNYGRKARYWSWRRKEPSSTAYPLFRSSTGCSVSRYCLRRCPELLAKRLWQPEWRRPGRQEQLPGEPQELPPEAEPGLYLAVVLGLAQPPGQEACLRVVRRRLEKSGRQLQRPLPEKQE